MVPRVGQHDPPRARQVEAEPEESVVGSDEVMASRLDGDRPAGAADSRIHDRQMHPGRRVRKRLCQHRGALGDRVTADAVREVEHLRVRRDAGDHGAAEPRKLIVMAVVGQKGDRPRHTVQSSSANVRTGAV
jgi:hypothetical protein